MPRSRFCRPAGAPEGGSGASQATLGLTPRAINFRPFGAKKASFRIASEWGTSPGTQLCGVGADWAEGAAAGAAYSTAAGAAYMTGAGAGT